MKTRILQVTGLGAGILALSFALPENGPLWSVTQVAFFDRRCPGTFLFAAGALMACSLLAYSSLRTKLHPRILLVASVAGFVALAWAFRDRTHLMGDTALWIRSAAERGGGIHTYREPLAAKALGVSVDLLDGMISAEHVLALISILCGIVVLLCVRSLLRRVPREPRSGDPGPAAFFILLGQPLAFLFFGYTETYPLLLAAIAVTLVSLQTDLAKGRIGVRSVVLLVITALTHYLGALLTVCLIVTLLLPTIGPRWWPLVSGFILLSGGLVAAIFPQMRVHTTFFQHWSIGRMIAYLADVLNAWIVAAVPMGIVLFITNKREESANQHFRRLVTLLLYCFLGLPLVAYFELGLYRDIDLLGPAMLCIVFLSAMACRNPLHRRNVLIGSLVGALFLAAWLSNNVCVAGIQRFEGQLQNSSLSGQARSYGFETLYSYYDNQGNRRKAEEMAGRALQETPGNTRLWAIMGDNQLARRDTAAAIASYERALKSNRWSEVAARLGELLDRRGNSGRAIELLESNRDAALRDPGAAAALAVAYYHAGLPESTVAVSTLRLLINPEDALACFNKGMGLIALGRRSEAVQAFDRAAQLAPENRVYRQQADAVRRLAR